MHSHDIDKTYVSPYDRFLYEFDATHAKSVSQLAEIKKHQRIALLRDTPCSDPQADAVWKAF